MIKWGKMLFFAMCSTIINDKQDISIQTTIKPLKPFYKQQRFHPCIWICSILAVEIIMVNILKVSWIKKLTDDPQRKYVRAIVIATNNNYNPLYFSFDPLTTLLQESYQLAFDKISQFHLYYRCPSKPICLIPLLLVAN